MRKSSRALVGIAIVAGVFLAACSSDDGGSADDSVETTEATTDTATETTAAGGDDSETTEPSTDGPDLSESQAVVERWLAEPDNVGVTEVLTEAPPADKTLIWLECSVPECVVFGDGVQAGAEALGWNFSRVAFDLTPEAAQTAFESALAQQPDAIMSVAIDPSWITEQRQQAIDAGVAFFDCCSNYESDPLLARGGFGGVTAPPTGLLEGPDHVRYQASVLADYAAVATDGNVNAAVVYIPDFPIGIVAYSGFADRLAEICPDTCTAEPLEITIADIGTNVGSKVVSALQRNPEINTIFYISGSFGIGVDAALVEAGLQDQVLVVGNNPIPSSFEDMLRGDVEAVWLGLSSKVVGWRYVDQAIRHFQGQTLPEKPEGPDDTGPAAWAPIQLLTAENYPEAIPFDRPTNYEEIFSGLWLLPA